ncbi:hypothetical protein LXL04_019132 [Taraxacum kok-saghyz]
MGELNEVASLSVIQWIQLHHCEMPHWHSMYLEFNAKVPEHELRLVLELIDFQPEYPPYEEEEEDVDADSPEKHCSRSENTVQGRRLLQYSDKFSCSSIKSRVPRTGSRVPRIGSRVSSAISCFVRRSRTGSRSASPVLVQRSEFSCFSGSAVLVLGSRPSSRPWFSSSVTPDQRPAFLGTYSQRLACDPFFPATLGNSSAPDLVDSISDLLATCFSRRLKTAKQNMLLAEFELGAVLSRKCVLTNRLSWEFSICGLSVWKINSFLRQEEPFHRWSVMYSTPKRTEEVSEISCTPACIAKYKNCREHVDSLIREIEDIKYDGYVLRKSEKPLKEKLDAQTKDYRRIY